MCTIANILIPIADLFNCELRFQWRKLARFVEPEPVPGGITSQLEHGVPMLLSLQPLLDPSGDASTDIDSMDDQHLFRMLEDEDRITELEPPPSQTSI